MNNRILRMIISLQYLRAIACLLVIILHITKKMFLNGDISSYMYMGASGVDLFFVISGFIIIYISDKNTKALSFIKNRVIRIYPTYLILLLPYLAIFILYPELVNSHSSQTPSIFKSVSLLPFPVNGGLVNIVSWTLTFEFYFYFVFAIALFLKRDLFWTSSVAILLLLAVGQLFNIPFLRSAIVIEFIMGMAIYKFLFKPERMPGKPLSLLLVALGAGLLCAFPGHEIDGTGFDRVLLWGAPAAIVFIGAIALERQLRKMNFLVLLGNSSYTAYLTHILSINAVYVVTNNMLQLPPAVTISGAVILSLIVGIVSHKMIELPTINFFKKRKGQLKKGTQPQS
ncbi:acyltransferase family protein [Serratia rubidaea]|uniref:Acyltransferase n=2 Tax=Serratia rubidaea TaxID=61652 RepID=A0ABS0MBX5_SERRU|nr:acyltransferase [Serratia rubidaea]MBH1929873.1 acyltransferase [Serratia rubidaea]MEB7587002.1 acyltransferase [Serratia rubidaea]